MPRGGYQKPSKPAGASAPGKGSRRTDGRVQPIREPDIDDPSLEYGDRQNLTDAQRIAGIANKPSQGQRRPTGSPPVSRQRKLPPWLFAGESAFPQEPGSAGLAMGPGPGPEALVAQGPAPDLRVTILTYFRDMYGNQDAAEMLEDYYAEQSQKTAAPAVGALEEPLGA